MRKPHKENDAADSFQRFKKTMKDILSVSRKELQEEMDKYKREKMKRKRAG